MLKCRKGGVGGRDILKHYSITLSIDPPFEEVEEGKVAVYISSKVSVRIMTTFTEITATYKFNIDKL